MPARLSFSTTHTHTPIINTHSIHTKHTHTRTPTLPGTLAITKQRRLSAPLGLHGVSCICNWLSLVAALRIYISTYQQLPWLQPQLSSSSRNRSARSALCQVFNCWRAQVLLLLLPLMLLCLLLLLSPLADIRAHTPNIFCFQSHLPIYS